MTSAAALEIALQTFLMTKITERDGVTGSEVASKVRNLSRLTAGQLLGQLRDLKVELPHEQLTRIADVIGRRNDLMHRTFDGERAQALTTDQNWEAVIADVDRVALDSAELMFELPLSAAPSFFAQVGFSPTELLAFARAGDLDEITDPALRERWTAVKSLISLPEAEALLSDLTPERLMEFFRPAPPGLDG